MPETIKIFNMDDCTWIAAANVEDAWRALAEFFGYGESEASVAEAKDDNQGFEPEELTDAELDRLTYHEHDLDDECHGVGCPVTFREQLARMVREGREFPCFFATTEY